MRLALAFLAACGAAPPAPTTPPPKPVTLDAALAPMQPLVGHWAGDDPDRHSHGEFTLAGDLGGKVLVRHNANDDPHGHHEDVMIVYPAPAGLRASYFDNEGHVIQYAITATPQRIEMLSDDVAGQPRFELVYDVRSADELAIDFAIAMPGSTEMKHFTGGVVHRVK